MPPKKGTATSAKSRAAARLDGEPPSKTGARVTHRTAKRDLSEKNQELLKRYLEFQHILRQQMEKHEQEFKERMRKLDEDEKASFESECRKYTEEQLNMTCIEFEQHLRQQAEAEAATRLEAKNEIMEPPKANVYEFEDEDDSSGGIVRVRVKFAKKTRSKKVSDVRKSKSKPRRPSFANQFATPASGGTATLRRFVPKFMKTGIKESQPRAARPGEIVLSENGSPVFVPEVTAKLTVLNIEGDF